MDVTSHLDIQRTNSTRYGRSAETKVSPWQYSIVKDVSFRIRESPTNLNIEVFTDLRQQILSTKQGRQTFVDQATLK